MAGQRMHASHMSLCGVGLLYNGDMKVGFAVSILAVLMTGCASQPAQRNFLMRTTAAGKNSTPIRRSTFPLTTSLN